MDVSNTMPGSNYFKIYMNEQKCRTNKCNYQLFVHIKLDFIGFIF